MGDSGPRGITGIFAAALILIAGAAAYSNSFDGIFVFDDEPSIERNPNLLSLWPLRQSMSAPLDTTLSGRPVASLSFAIDHALSPEGPLRRYHATNLGIHLTAALLLFGFGRRTLVTPRLFESFGNPATPLALIIALVFVVHPIQTGSVTYIVQRVESLTGLFYLATLYCAVRALEGQGRRVWAGAAIAASALGMATKEVMVTAPLMVVIWDRLFVPDRIASRRRLHAGLLATWLILAPLVAGGHRSLSAGFGFSEWPWWRYLMTQAEVVFHYLRLSLFPSPLVLDYQWPPPASMADVAGPVTILGVLLAGTVFGLVRRSPSAFAGVWFFLILAPTSSVLPIVTEVAAEHRMYLPVAGVIALVVLCLYRVGRLLAASARLNPDGILAGAGLMAAAVTVVFFAWMTHERNADYQNYDRIWSDTIAKRPRNARARNNYATSLLAQGRFSDAETHLRVAVAENPAFPEAQANLGVAFSAQGRLDEGADHLRRAIALRPGYADAHRNLGETYALQKRMGDAVAEYSKALEALPEDVELLNRAAWILATSRDDTVRDGGRARTLAERAVRLTLEHDAVSLDSLGAALAETGSFEAALREVRQALAMARLKGDQALALQLEDRLNSYQRGQAFRDPAS